MARFKVRVYDKEALGPRAMGRPRVRGWYVQRLETDSIAEAGKFMEEQVEACSLHVDGRVVLVIRKPVEVGE